MRVVPRRGWAGAARTDERKFWDPSSWPAQTFGRRNSPPAVSAERDRRGKGLLPKYGGETFVGLYRALELLRRPLRFDELVGNGFNRHQENPASVTWTGTWFKSTAMSRHVMRGGRHFVEFTLTQAHPTALNVHFGVIRPVSIDLLADYVSSSRNPAVLEKLRSQRTAKWRDSTVHCCTYYCKNGHGYWTLEHCSS